SMPELEIRFRASATHADIPQVPDGRVGKLAMRLTPSLFTAGWRALKAHVDALTVDGQLFNAARNGDVRALAALLDAPRTSCTPATSRTSGRCCTPRRRRDTWKPWTCC